MKCKPSAVFPLGIKAVFTSIIIWPTWLKVLNVDSQNIQYLSGHKVGPHTLLGNVLCSLWGLDRK